ncbi:Fis family two component sigma-54 specific transcriptional regulator [Hyphomicrobium denitrificans 1NES1]|uniref:Fis family two component sigma-54 specific transcriptional regulator n=1 Tax=Hyphomicrobium denitrificans 1NES1 TaxID=670307 RepID=N0B417_9HYPH|nr:sigma-54 dependent transcriptional regulator [Hyphomicrobium denitrificans]AGK57738.1 Fis family two component sigma-54 specific transcriptional regulator [Hyphomicrobium denitrificans 1NES1]
MSADILIVDDEADIRDLIAGILQDEGHRTRLARDSDEALRAIEDRKPHLVILDIWLQGSRLDGLEVLTIMKRTYPDLPVVIISGHGNIETAVTAIKRGAYDYIEKPFKADRLVLVTLRALEASQLKREVRELKERSVVSAEMIGKSPAINQLKNNIDKAGPTNSRIMLRGASGSGKELAARVLHQKSLRADGPFVVLNAAAMVPDRVEEELFGTEDRTGGPRKVGALEEAHTGTLYIDEVADMPMETQGKVLRVLVEQKFLRLGGSQKVSVDVRIISSTSRDLDQDIREGRFREDLYHRLNVVTLRVPSLAERREDIPDLIQYFVGQVAQTSGLAPRRIGEDAIAVLQAHDWPGNVRELRNNVERLLILAGGDPNAAITADMLPDEIGSNVPLPVNGGAEHLMSLPLREAREIFEREYLLAQINRFGGNISRTAEFVGMERSALHRKLRALGVSSEQRAGDLRSVS